jgi:sulfur carrier protein
MLVRVNDEELELPEPSTVQDLLARLQLPGTRVAVELNRGIVRRADHATTPLRPGDRVEVVTLVGGG